ncbi:MAG: hypothetical protein HP043_03315, partial [Dialister sp.]|nr:hypothetical protein [Dialister sp.]
ALDYFRKAREKRDAVSLYASISDDLKTQTVPTQKPMTLDHWKRMVYHDEDPLKLYNTAEAPIWYIDDKEKNCLLTAGLLAFCKQDFETARQAWSKLKEVDRDLAEMDPRLPNLFSRLQAAAKYHYMSFSAKEKDGLKDDRIRLKILYAEFLCVQELFDDAEIFYLKLSRESNIDAVKGLCWIGIGDCMEIRGGKESKKKAAEYYRKVLFSNTFEKSDLYALALYRYGLSLLGTFSGQQTAMELYEQYAGTFPQGRHARAVNFHRIRYLIQTGKLSEARMLYKDFALAGDGYSMCLQDMFRQSGRQ